MLLNEFLKEHRKGEAQQQAKLRCSSERNLTAQTGLLPSKQSQMSKGR